MIYSPKGTYRVIGPRVNLVLLGLGDLDCDKTLMKVPHENSAQGQVIHPFSLPDKRDFF